jgi:outer membrane lipoprotein-sorting protein
MDQELAMSKVGRAVGLIVLSCLFATGCGVERVQADVRTQAKTRLEIVLTQMNEASAKFQGAQADVRKDVYTKIVDDHDVQSGLIYFLRTPSGTQMGTKMTTGAHQVVEYKDGKVRLFNPGTNHVDEVSASGASKGRVETFLTLGFGGSGRELAKAWTIKDDGPEQMMDGGKSVEVEKLDLVSKDEDSRKLFSHVTIWVDPVRGVSLKQVFYSPSGDTQTALYSNVRLVPKVDVGQFAIKCKGACS